MRIPPAAHRSVDADLTGVLAVLCAEPTPRGEERATAERLATYVRERWPHLTCRVELVGATGANLLVLPRGSTTTPDDLLLCSHLDTSLSGYGARDVAVTGRHDDAPRGIERYGDALQAAGLTVARGPAAAALVGFAAAVADGSRAVRLVLSGSGTHAFPAGRAEGAARGLATHLAEHPLPTAALVAKCGPPGLLWEEPGAAYLRVTVRGARGAALAREAFTPSGGVPAMLPTVLREIECWRTELRSRALPAGQTGREAAVGSVVSGLERKPDLLPGVARIGIYLVLAVGDDLDELVAALGARLGAATAPHTVEVEIEVTLVDPAGSTAPEHRVVRSARTAWTAAHGAAPAAVVGWTGSTDGAHLRGRGVPTVRTGPVGRAAATDDRCDTLSLAQLRAFAGIYGAVVEDWGAAGGRNSSNDTSGA